MLIHISSVVCDFCFPSRPPALHCWFKEMEVRSCPANVTVCSPPTPTHPHPSFSLLFSSSHFSTSLPLVHPVSRSFVAVLPFSCYDIRQIASLMWLISISLWELHCLTPPVSFLSLSIPMFVFPCLVSRCRVEFLVSVMSCSITQAILVWWWW